MLARLSLFLTVKVENPLEFSSLSRWQAEILQFSTYESEHTVFGVRGNCCALKIDVFYIRLYSINFLSNKITFP